VLQIQLVCGIIETLHTYRDGLLLSNISLHVVFGFTVKELGGFLVFSQTLGMLSTTGDATKSAQATHFKRG
jgi:hypothetical protein